MIKNGWHKINSTQSVFTENGMIIRAISNNRPASVYRWNSTLSCWTNACPVKYETFRRGYRDGRYDIA